MKNIKEFRKLAELHLCADCFQTYKALIEPNIRELLSKHLGDWPEVESYITQMVMKTMGIFKDKTIFISLDDDSKDIYSGDMKVFQDIKRCNFKKKIDYLRKKGILLDSSYRLLDKARRIRNAIHDEYAQFSEQDQTLFNITKVVVSQIWNATMFDLKDDISAALKSNAENCAEQYLKTNITL